MLMNNSQYSTNDESHNSPDNDNQGTEISLNAIETVLNERNISEGINFFNHIKLLYYRIADSCN